jgi:hypothetical protein
MLLALSDAVWASILALLGVVWTGIMTIALALINRVKKDVADVKQTQTETNVNVEKIEKATNSMMAAHNQLTETEALARGKLIGGREQKAKTDADSLAMPPKLQVELTLPADHHLTKDENDTEKK